MNKRMLSLLLAALMIFSLCAQSVGYVSAANDLKTSEKCIALIKKMEGFEPKAKYDYGQYSIGYGTACEYGQYPNGITEAEADKLLREDLTDWEDDLHKFAKKNNLTLSQQQFDALISFTYNLGSNWMYNTSTFRTAVINGAKGNDFIFAITRWCNAGNEILPGLVERRLAEANMYLNGVYSDKAPANYRYVVFDNNVADAVSDVKIQGYDANQRDQLRASPAKAGYRFLGWYTLPQGGEWIETVDSTAGVSKLYAHWQSVDNPEAMGLTANYVRYAGKNQQVYENHYGSPNKKLEDGAKLTIVADYMDNNGVKWGRLSEGGWVKLSETQNATTATQGEAVNLKVTVDTNGVNIRTGPGTSYPKAGMANKGQQLQLTRVQQGGMYLWGQFSGGWICLDYTDYKLAVLDNDPDADKVTATGVIINTAKLNIRSLPSASSTKVGEYSRGDKVTITLQRRVGNTLWGKTEKGWISLYYVKVTPVKEPEATEPVAPTEPAKPTEPVTPTEPAKPTEPSTPAEPKEEVVATGSIVGCVTLRIRAGAGTKHAEVGSLVAGTKVNLYELKVVGKQVWGRMDKGWISLEYVKLDVVDSGDVDGIKGTVKECSGLNIRVGAGTNYASLGKYQSGERVTILALTVVNKTVWGLTNKGWVSMDYITLDADGSGSAGGSQTPTQPDDSGNTGSGDAGQSKPDTTQKFNQTGVIVGTAQVRLRKEPSASSKEVGTLKKGDRIVILETAKNGSSTWGRTEKGWVHMFYVQVSTTEVPEGSVVRTVTTNLRIRAGAGTSYEAIGSYLRGAQVLITAQTTVKGTVWGRTDKGWISMDYVK